MTVWWVQNKPDKYHWVLSNVRTTWVLRCLNLHAVSSRYEKVPEEIYCYLARSRKTLFHKQKNRVVKKKKSYCRIPSIESNAQKTFADVGTEPVKSAIFSVLTSKNEGEPRSWARIISFLPIIRLRLALWVIKRYLSRVWLSDGEWPRLAKFRLR